MIPAKKYSRRLPHKNKLGINGKPLVQYAIDVAVESNLFDRIYVSSDDEDILYLAYTYMDGSIVSKPNKSRVLPHLRPKLLARSSTQLRELMRFAVYQLKMNDVFCLLTPCNPFRTVDDLINCWKLYWDKKANYVVSVKQVRPPPQWSHRIKNGYLEPFLGHEYMQRSQNLEKLYVHDGTCIFANCAKFVKEFDMDFHGTNCVPYITPHISIDIDTKEEYEYAKFLMLNAEHME